MTIVDVKPDLMRGLLEGRAVYVKTSTLHTKGEAITLRSPGEDSLNVIVISCAGTSPLKGCWLTLVRIPM